MLMRFDPFRELDRITQQVWDPARNVGRSMPMDAYRVGDELVARIDLPGVDPSKVELTVEKNVLTVKAERYFPDEGAEVLVAERPQGSFTRQLFLGEMLDVDRVQAQCDQGVLTLRIPVTERAKPRRVEVTSSEPSEPRTLETSQADSSS